MQPPAALDLASPPPLSSPPCALAVFHANIPLSTIVEFYGITSLPTVTPQQLAQAFGAVYGIINGICGQDPGTAVPGVINGYNPAGLVAVRACAPARLRSLGRHAAPAGPAREAGCRDCVLPTPPRPVVPPPTAAGSDRQPRRTARGQQTEHRPAGPGQER